MIIIWSSNFIEFISNHLTQKKINKHLCVLKTSFSHFISVVHWCCQLINWPNVNETRLTLIWFDSIYEYMSRKYEERWTNFILVLVAKHRIEEEKKIVWVRRRLNEWNQWNWRRNREIVMAHHRNKWEKKKIIKHMVSGDWLTWWKIIPISDFEFYI